LTDIHILSLHDALPIYQSVEAVRLASITAPWLPSAQSEWVELAQDQRSFQLSVEQTASLINAMDSGLWTSLRAGNTEIIIPTIQDRKSTRLNSSHVKSS